MNVLLIQPPIRDFYHTGHRMYPLGLLHLASALRESGFPCEVLDAFSGERKKALPIPRSMSYLEEYYPAEDKSPFRLFGRFYHFGLLDEQIREKIAAADLVGIGTLFTPYEEESLAIARTARELGKLTLLGGCHATVAAAHLMEDPAVDYVILGEGEARIAALAEAICGCRSFESIDGLAWRSKGSVKISPPRCLVSDLDELPFPDRSLLDPDRYRFQGERYTMMLSSRGCPYRCRFCSGHTIFGHTVRLRSIESILAEMRLCYDRYRIRVFDFEDEHFTWQRERTIQVLDAIEAEFGHDPAFGLLFENGLFPHTLDREILSRLKKLGCRHLNLPLVSSSASTLTRLKRPGLSSSFARTVGEAAESDFFITGYLILGLPGSSLEEMVESIRFLAAQPVLIAPSIFYATPGMELYDECRKSGWLPEGGFTLLRSSAFAIETGQFRRLDLVTLFRLVRMLNFIKSLIDEAAGRAGEEEEAKGETAGGEIKLSAFLKSLMQEFRQDILDYRAGADLPETQPYAPETDSRSAGACSSSSITSPRPLSPRELGLWLLAQWLTDGHFAFYRVQVEKQKATPASKRKQGSGIGQEKVPCRWTYRMVRQADSERVWRIFLDLIDQTSIRGVKNPSLSPVWDISKGKIP
ncbi:MAG: radical SAM protein [bacterium]